MKSSVHSASTEAVVLGFLCRIPRSSSSMTREATVLHARSETILWSTVTSIAREWAKARQSHVSQGLEIGRVDGEGGEFLVGLGRCSGLSSAWERFTGVTRYLP